MTAIPARAKTTVKMFAYRALKRFYELRHTFPVWYYLLNYRRRRWLKRYATPLTKAQERVVSDLRRDGIAITSLQELLPGIPLATFESYARRLRAEGNEEIRKGKQFFSDLWDPHPVIERDNPFLSLALESRVLAVAAGYLRVWPLFYYLTLNVTTPVPDGKDRTQSQRWHRDPEDKRMCKMFLYVNDVDETSGPFNYVRRSHYGGVYNRLYPQDPPGGVRLPVGVLEGHIPESAVTVCTGKAGTVVFADTAGFHRGGYATAKERIMFTAGFYTNASPWPPNFTLAPGLLETGRFDERARHALPSPSLTVGSRIFVRFNKLLKWGSKTLSM